MLLNANNSIMEKTIRITKTFFYEKFVKNCGLLERIVVYLIQLMKRWFQTIFVRFPFRPQPLKTVWMELNICR